MYGRRPAALDCFRFTMVQASPATYACIKYNKISLPAHIIIINSPWYGTSLYTFFTISTIPVVNPITFAHFLKDIIEYLIITVRFNCFVSTWNAVIK